jgi:hypothetical protein
MRFPRWKPLILTLVVAISVGFGGAHAAYASDPGFSTPPSPPAKDQTGHLQIPTTAPKGAVTASGVDECNSYANPSPQYSSTGGTYGTVHWGGKVICTEVGEIYISTNLYTIQGNGDNEHYVFEDEKVLDQVGSYVGGTWTTACLSSTSTRWIMNIGASWNGIQFNPYPAWTSVYTLPCG